MRFSDGSRKSVTCLNLAIRSLPLGVVGECFLDKVGFYIPCLLEKKEFQTCKLGSTMGGDLFLNFSYFRLLNPLAQLI